MSGVLVDANLLCLLAVGRVDIAAIRAHHRLRAFDAHDLSMLGAVLDRLGDPVLCPQVLAETSNLLGYRQSPRQRSILLRSLVTIVAMCSERTEQALRAIADDAYVRLGLTDAVLLLLAADGNLTLVSDDLALCLEAERRGLRVVNYNYLRDGALRPDQL